MANTTRERDLSFDFLKGVLIFLVVLGHCLNQLHTEHTQAALDVWVYSFHMPMFMFVCGYFAAHTLQKGTYYTCKKMAHRLLIPAVLWSAIIFIEKLTYGGHASVRLFYDACRGTWFLWCLLGLYLIAVLLWNTKRRWVWVLGISIAFYVLWPYYPIDVLKHFKIIQFFPVFCIGGICNSILPPPISQG